MIPKSKLVIGSTSSTFRLPKVEKKKLAVAPLQYPADPSWPAVDKTLEQQLLDYVNLHRKSIGVGPLVFSDNLVGCVEWKVRNMAQFLYMDHNDPPEPAYNNFPGRTVIARFADWGLLQGWGENIAYGFPDATSVLTAWLSDVGHRQNVENPNYTLCGMGACNVNGIIFWAQDFSYGKIPPPPPPTNTVFDEWKKDVLPLLQASTQYKNWRKRNVSDANLFDAVLSSPTQVAHGLTTPFGSFLCGTMNLIATDPPLLLSKWTTTDLPLLKKSGQFKGWVKANPGEASQFNAYLVSPTTQPNLNTAFGKFLVATIHLLSTN